MDNAGWPTSEEEDAAQLKLLGYCGTIGNGPVEEALDEQRAKLFEAHAIIETVGQGILQHFGGNCPAGVPDFERALRVAARMINEIAGALEAGTLEDHATNMAAKAEKSHV